MDRLIEDGLARYGAGDLDGALLVWEQALASDPENPQANSYVDYVRMNYELLTSEINREGEAPFGIADEEPEYQIEIDHGEPGEVSDASSDPIDEGWFIEAELNSTTGGGVRTLSNDYPQITLELDEETISRPPRVATASGEEINFEDATREYPGGKGKPSSDLLEQAGDPITSEFRGEETPPFGDELSDFQTPTGGWVTHVKKRELGFVQPTAPIAPQNEERLRQKSGPPELNITLRTPVIRDEDPTPPEDDLAIALDVAPPSDAELELAYEPDPVPSPPSQGPEDEPVELITSLPSPTPVHGVPVVTAPIPLVLPLPAPSSTRDLPGPTRPPAIRPDTAPRAQTSDFGPQPTGDFSSQRTEKLSHSAAQVAHAQAQRDKPTTKRPPMSRAGETPYMPAITAAPTQDLGIRQLARARARASSEDDTIHRGDTHALEATTPGTSPRDFEDPVDTRTGLILVEVDAGITEPEAKEDRTRRRITTLFERALGWQQAGDHDRAVAAVELALSEDPNSALAQKLIHRNRDTVMTVFAAHLGPLARVPSLARPLHELASAPISPRAAFLLSRIDGVLSLEEILDVCGMPRIEAHRYLCQLFVRGILR
ncbi:MAG: hypothetical protein WKG01_36005 [Kofleriaceae bacterium]